MSVFKSRHTPGAKGDEICLSVGETVEYLLLDGSTVNVRVTSGRMKHNRCRTFGFEGVFSDTGEIGFADGARIVNWEGKC
jgi:hypothetical protein